MANIIDTTAAGDSFNGAYIGAPLSGMTAQDAVKAAQGCAGQAIQHKGAIIPLSDISV